MRTVGILCERPREHDMNPGSYGSGTMECDAIMPQPPLPCPSGCCLGQYECTRKSTCEWRPKVGTQGIRIKGCHGMKPAGLPLSHPAQPPRLRLRLRRDTSAQRLRASMQGRGGGRFSMTCKMQCRPVLGYVGDFAAISCCYHFLKRQDCLESEDIVDNCCTESKNRWIRGEACAAQRAWVPPLPRYGRAATRWLRAWRVWGRG